MKSPRHWKPDLRRAFDTPIKVSAEATEDWRVNKNMAVPIFARLGGQLPKLDLLAQHYGQPDALKSKMGTLVLLSRLCEDLFDGFKVQWHEKQQPTVRTATADTAFVLKVRDICAERRVGVLRACKILKEQEPKIYSVAANTLKTRFMEAQRKPEVRETISALSKLTKEQWVELKAIYSGTP